MKCFILSILILCYATFVIIGGLIIMVLERNREKVTIQENADFKLDFLYNHTCVSSDELDQFIKLVRSNKYRIPAGNVTRNVTYDNDIWNVHTSIYFSTTVVTTIGYGNITPTTEGGRIFCVFFGLIGIPFALVLFAEIGIKLSLQLKRLGDLLEKKTPLCKLGDKHANLMRLIRYCFLQSIMFALLMLVPAIVFSYLETGWSYYEALYFTFVTLTTIGFGDYVAGFSDGQKFVEIYRIAIACWIVIGLAWMSSFLASASDAYSASLAKVDDKVAEKEAKLSGEIKVIKVDKDSSDSDQKASSDNNDNVIQDKTDIEMTHMNGVVHITNESDILMNTDNVNLKL